MTNSVNKPPQLTASSSNFNYDIQQKVDLLNQLAWGLREEDSPRALELSQSAENLAAGLNYPLGVALSWRNQGYCYLRVGKPHQVLDKLFKALPILELLDNKAEQAIIWHGVGVTHRRLANYADALAAHMREHELSQAR
jgi:tetratricopeptide (TPR) repeat protein